MTAPMPTALPYGMRDIKLTRYIDGQGSVLDTVSVDLPNARTLSFSETEEFNELRGDDRVVTTRGSGPSVEWELEAGGMSLRAWQILTGGTIIETGAKPNRQMILRKKGKDTKPWFRFEGQAISDSGGDVHTVLYRCRTSDKLEGEFNDGEFFLTSGSGTALPLIDDANDIVYDFIHNETAVAIPTSSIFPNPLNDTSPFGVAGA